MTLRNSLSHLLSALCALGLLTACSDGVEGNSDEPAIPGTTLCVEATAPSQSTLFSTYRSSKK